MTQLPQWATFGFAGGAIAAAWSQLRLLWSWLRGQAVRTVELQGSMADVMRHFLNLEYTPVRFGTWTCLGNWMWVRPVKDRIAVGVVVPSTSGLLYRKGWRFIFYKPNHSNNAVSESSITFFRWSFNEDALLIQALDTFNNRMLNWRQGCRFAIHRCFGRRYMPQRLSDNVSSHGSSAVPAGTPPRADYGSEAMTARYLKWAPEEVGMPTGAQALDTLALGATTGAVLREIEFWFKNREWFESHNVPWRRGFLLHGKPGTGKTSFVRAVAQKYDMPVFSFDLASMTNEDLFSDWSGMLRNAVAPVIAIVEDVDCVFEGRTNIIKDSPLTFDALLNCIDGVDQNQGILLFITTNNLDKIDPALANRPGRIDHKIEMLPPDAEGRFKIAKRILSDWPEHWSDIVVDGEGMTGSEFQNLCSETAMKLFWKKLT